MPPPPILQHTLPLLRLHHYSRFCFELSAWGGWSRWFFRLYFVWGQRGEVEGMDPGSSLRPPLSHVIIDLSKLWQLSSTKVQNSCETCSSVFFLFLSFLRKKMLLSLHPPHAYVRTHTHAHTLGRERVRVQKDSRVS